MNYFDLHCDTAAECFDRQCGLRSNTLNVSLEKTQSYERWTQIFAIFIHDRLRGPAAWERFCSIHRYFMEELEKNRDEITLCRSGAELKQASQNPGKTALLSIEGSAALAGKLDALPQVHRMGIRLITLTWNGRSEAGDGCMEKNAGGLTDFGKNLVREMNRLNLIVDVSHLSEAGFWDVARTAQRPFVATHSDSASVHRHPRNLSDDQFREIVKEGGLVGLNFYGAFLGGNGGLEEILRHAEHFLTLGGEKTLALGSDFDGCTLQNEIRTVEDMNKLQGAMQQHFGSEITDNLFYNNAFRFFSENL